MLPDVYRVVKSIIYICLPPPLAPLSLALSHLAPALPPPLLFCLQAVAMTDVSEVRSGSHSIGFVRTSSTHVSFESFSIISSGAPMDLQVASSATRDMLVDKLRMFVRMRKMEKLPQRADGRAMSRLAMSGLESEAVGAMVGLGLAGGGMEDVGVAGGGGKESRPLTPGKNTGATARFGIR